MHYVYILKLNNEKYYTGMTNNIDRRLREHIKGKSISTCHYRPLKLMFVTLMSDKFIARKLEVKIKNKGAKLFIIKNRLEREYTDLTNHLDILRSTLTFFFIPVLEHNNFVCRLPKHV